MLFRIGHSYAWVFFLWMVTFVALAAGDSSTEIVAGLTAHELNCWMFAAIFGFVLVSQLRSGVALDHSWRATYPRGTVQFWLGNALLAVVVCICTWHAIRVSSRG